MIRLAWLLAFASIVAFIYVSYNKMKNSEWLTYFAERGPAILSLYIKPKPDKEGNISYCLDQSYRYEEGNLSMFNYSAKVCSKTPSELGIPFADDKTLKDKKAPVFSWVFPRIGKDVRDESDLFEVIEMILGKRKDKRTFDSFMKKMFTLSDKEYKNMKPMSITPGNKTIAFIRLYDFVTTNNTDNKKTRVLIARVYVTKNRKLQMLYMMFLPEKTSDEVKQKFIIFLKNLNVLSLKYEEVN